MAGPEQTDFRAGEISPLLYGQRREEFYARGAAAMRNFIVTKLGNAMSRPGTTWVGDVATSPIDRSGIITDEQNHADDSVLIPFIAGDDESFCLVFQPGLIQFITRGGYVESTPGVRYQVITPYGYSDLRKLHYAQVGEVLTIVTPGWDSYELRHVSDAPPSWTFTRAVTSPLPLDGVTVAYVDPDSSPLQPTTGFSLVDGDGSPDIPLPTPDSDHPAREWQWKVTAVCRETSTGRLFETLPALVSEKYDGADYDGSAAPLPSDTWPVYRDSDFRIVLRRAETAGLLPAPSPDFTVVSYNIYRGRGTLFGFIGQTTSREFVDVGDEPDFNYQPPAGTDPFGANLEATTATAPLLSGSELSLGLVVRHYDRAAAVAYFEQRRHFAGLTRREYDLVSSATSDFDNFDDRQVFHISGESVVYSIAARKRGRIRHLVPMDRLVVLTSGASYHAGGQPGTPGLDFDSVWIPLIEEVGANDVTPVVVDGTCFFARAKGRGLRGLISEGNQGGFQGFDASFLAEHLFRGVDRSIVDLTYAEDPWSTIWAVRADGVLLSLTYDRAQKMLAWARHDMVTEDDDGNETAHGTVESVCAVPEDDEDAVYLVVKRTIAGVVHRYVERMTSRHERGGAVLSAGGLPILTPPDYICVDCAVPFVGVAGTSYTVITGLAHLEGKEVWVLGQSLTPTRHTVSGGQIDLGYTLEPNIPAGEDSPGGARVLVYVGLLYTPELELLPVAGGERTGMKQVTHVSFVVDQARGIQVAQDSDTLDAQPDRDVQDGFGTQPLRSEVVEVPVRGTWDYSAGMVLRQPLPLPVTVLALGRRLATGGP